MAGTAYSQHTGSFAIYFDFNQHQLTGTGITVLDSFIRAENVSQVKADIRLYGHCDFIGSDKYNELLSQRRVRTVHDYLLNNGISKNQIIIMKGFGEKKPLNDNETEEQRQLNRRVEIELIREPKENESLKEKIADTSTIAGTNIILKNINFYGGRHQFLPQSEPALQELLEAMRAYQNLVIRIEGHICCQPFSNDGLDNETGLNNLSEARAKAIQDYLIENGIEPGRLSYKGFGHSAPIYPFPEQNEEERVMNRRVEIKILRK
jgi:outer membrane protein OmpA-like peptidoglycan-associated protein